MTCGSAFIPVGNDGWLISEAAPQCMPTFELNEAIALKAGRHGLDFALSMIKPRGFGGKKANRWPHGSAETVVWSHAVSEAASR